MSEKSAIIIVFFVEKCYNVINTLMRWRNRNGDVSYKKLWIMLTEKGIKKDQLIADGIFSRATLTKMNKNENVALSVLVNICRYLKCDIGDIMEVLPEGDTD